jgi:hypothetical protein
MIPWGVPRKHRATRRPRDPFRRDYRGGVVFFRERPKLWVTATPTLSQRHGNRMSDPRINQQIRVGPVMLIDADGTHRGIVPIDVARDVAHAQGLDLVEIAPMASPPGVRIMKWRRPSQAN